MHGLNGRTKILVDDTYVDISNVINVLEKALKIHDVNRMKIDYLWNYRLGNQPILNRKKDVRPEILNKIVENRADEIVSFKSGYLMGEPIQYISRGKGEDILDDVTLLNEYAIAEEKASKDKELSDWMHTVGVGYRMALPCPYENVEFSPFEIYTLDPRNTFVVYTNTLDEKPVLGVRYVVDEEGNIHYSCYTDNMYFEIMDGEIVLCEPHYLGCVPIVEYPLNITRTGAFELVIPLLDAINTTESNRVDGVEQFIQSLMLFHNVDISTEGFNELKEMGAIKYKDVDPSLQGDIKYLTSVLDQGETQTLVDHMYNTVLTICGMPSQGDGNTSDSSNNGAVILRNGWQSAEARAKDTELYFKKSERMFLRNILNICRVLSPININVHEIEIRFTRRNYENITQKVQVLDMMLNNGKIHPKLAFEHSGMFSDPDLAYEQSVKYIEEHEAKEINEVQDEIQSEGLNGGNPIEDIGSTE